MKPESIHLDPIAQIAAAVRALLERAHRLHHDATQRRYLVETDGLGHLWIAIGVGMALVAARVTLDELAGQTVEIATGQSLPAQLLSTQWPLDEAEVATLRAAAREARDAKRPLTLADVDLDAWELLAALDGLHERERISVAAIEMSGRRWVVLGHSLRQGRIALSQMPLGADSDRTTLDPPGPVAVEADEVPATASRPPPARASAKLYKSRSQSQKPLGAGTAHPQLAEGGR